jgi:hypothetical protein
MVQSADGGDTAFDGSFVELLSCPFPSVKLQFLERVDFVEPAGIEVIIKIIQRFFN